MSEYRIKNNIEFHTKSIVEMSAYMMLVQGLVFEKMSLLSFMSSISFLAVITLYGMISSSLMSYYFNRGQIEDLIKYMYTAYLGGCFLLFGSLCSGVYSSIGYKTVIGAGIFVLSIRNILKYMYFF